MNSPKKAKSRGGGNRLVLPLLLCCVGLLWFRWKRTSSSSEGLDSAGLAVPAVLDLPKPAYCRQNLPGCVPKTVQRVFFLEVPEVGGRSAAW